MKKFLLLLCILLGISGYTFAITQTVNEKDGVNYWYIKDIYKKWSTYFLSVDYIQYYQWYEAALARAEDGVIFWDLSTDYIQNYPASYYTTDKNGERIATKAIKKKITSYLIKIGNKWFSKLIKNTDFNKLSEIERMIIGPTYDPATWWGGGEYKRNINTKIRTIPFASSAKITVEWNSLSLDELVTWQKTPTQDFVKVFLKKWKIEWFRVEYHP